MSVLESASVSHSIWGLIDSPAKHAVRAHSPAFVTCSPADTETFRPGLVFIASFRPFGKKGARSLSCREMRVTITPNDDEPGDFDIDVRYSPRRSNTDHVHFTGTVPAEELGRTLIALDSNIVPTSKTVKDNT